jgi:PKD repeat protein
MKTKLILLILTFLVFTACKKRKYPAEKVKLEDEEIYVSGSFGGEPVNLVIGSEGYYCYSAFTQSADSVYLFSGELKKFDCNPCLSALRIDLGDQRKSKPGYPIVPDSSLQTGRRSFMPALAKAITLHFGAYSNKVVTGLNWKLGNGVSSSSGNFNYEFTVPGAHTLSLTVKTKNNCESMVSNKIFVNDDGSIFACAVASGSLQNRIADLDAQVTGGKAPFTYSWNFGDGQAGNLKSVSHDYKYAGSYPVKLIVEDADHHTCEANYILVTGGDPSSCATGITFTVAGSRNTQINGVKIQWTDDLNITYRSDLLEQPAESYFEILGSQPYAANERGEQGRLLKMRFNILLTGNGRQVWFKSENAALAVSYK